MELKGSAALRRNQEVKNVDMTPHAIQPLRGNIKILQVLSSFRNSSCCCWRAIFFVLFVFLEKNDLFFSINTHCCEAFVVQVCDACLLCTDRHNFYFPIPSEFRILPIKFFSFHEAYSSKDPMHCASLKRIH